MYFQKNSNNTMVHLMHAFWWVNAVLFFYSEMEDGKGRKERK